MKLIEIIFNFIGIFISYIIVLKCYSLINVEVQNKLSLFIKILLFILFCSLTAINNLYNYVALRLIFSFILVILFLTIWFKEKIKKVIMNYSIMFIVLMIFEILTLILLTLLGANDINALNSNFILKTLYSSFVFILLLLLCKFNKVTSFFLFLQAKLYNLVTFNNVLFLFLIALSILSAIYGANYKNINIYILTILIFMIILLLSILVLKNSYFRKELEIKNKNLVDNIEFYEEIVNDYRILKHNLTNDLLNIKSITNSEYQNLINNIIQKYQKNYAWVTNVNNVPEGIKGLIYLKMNDIKATKINFLIDSSFDEDYFKNLKVSKYNVLCEAIGICLDNAIQAASESKEKSIFMGLSKNKNQKTITIVNSFNNEIDLEKIGKKNYSTKAQKSGIGMYYLNKISKNNFKFKNSITNNLFEIQIYLN